MLLLAAGALAAAALTSSRGALAVALVAGCIWNFMRVLELSTVHLPFLGFWLIAAVLAVASNAPAARHLVAIAALAWLISTGFGLDQSRYSEPVFTCTAGFGVMLGAGLALASRGPPSLRAFGLTLSHYGALALALTLAGLIAVSTGYPRVGVPAPVLACAAAAVALAFIATLLERRASPAMAGAAIVLALIVVSGRARVVNNGEPWVLYALALAAALCIVISGMLDEVRPRVAAGWIGLGLGIAAITWTVRGSLLDRAIFLAAAGIVVIAIAALLGRVFRKERTA
jgi:hypothetical protein